MCTSFYIDASLKVTPPVWLIDCSGPFLCTQQVTPVRAMTSKGAKETLVTKLGFKSSSSVSKAEAELERLKQENAHLRRKIDEATRRHARPPSSDKSKLLEVNQSPSSLSYRIFPCFFGVCLWNKPACLTLLCLFCHSCVACDVFRGFCPSRRCERETINSYLLRSKSWKP